jgi:hypothetical protein
VSSKISQSSQIRLLRRTQEALELSFFSFAQKRDPLFLECKGWTCPEAGELSDWAWHYTRNPTPFVKAYRNGTPPNWDNVFKPLTNLRNNAVHRTALDTRQFCSAMAVARDVFELLENRVESQKAASIIASIDRATSRIRSNKKPDLLEISEIKERFGREIAELQRRENAAVRAVVARNKASANSVMIALEEELASVSAATLGTSLPSGEDQLSRHVVRSSGEIPSAERLPTMIPDGAPLTRNPEFLSSEVPASTQPDEEPNDAAALQQPARETEAQSLVENVLEDDVKQVENETTPIDPTTFITTDAVIDKDEAPLSATPVTATASDGPISEDEEADMLLVRDPWGKLVFGRHQFTPEDHNFGKNQVAQHPIIDECPLESINEDYRPEKLALDLDLDKEEPDSSMLAPGLRKSLSPTSSSYLDVADEETFFPLKDVLKQAKHDTQNIFLKDLREMRQTHEKDEVVVRDRLQSDATAYAAKLAALLGGQRLSRKRLRKGLNVERAAKLERVLRSQLDDFDLECRKAFTWSMQQHRARQLSTHAEVMMLTGFGVPPALKDAATALEREQRKDVLAKFNSAVLNSIPQSAPKSEVWDARATLLLARALKSFTGRTALDKQVRLDEQGSVDERVQQDEQVQHDQVQQGEQVQPDERVEQHDQIQSDERVHRITVPSRDSDRMSRLKQRRSQLRKQIADAKGNARLAQTGSASRETFEVVQSLERRIMYVSRALRFERSKSEQAVSSPAASISERQPISKAESAALESSDKFPNVAALSSNEAPTETQSANTEVVEKPHSAISAQPIATNAAELSQTPVLAQYPSGTTKDLSQAAENVRYVSASRTPEENGRQLGERMLQLMQHGLQSQTLVAELDWTDRLLARKLARLALTLEDRIPGVSWENICRRAAALGDFALGPDTIRSRTRIAAATILTQSDCERDVLRQHEILYYQLKSRRMFPVFIDRVTEFLPHRLHELQILSDGSQDDENDLPPEVARHIRDVAFRTLILLAKDAGPAHLALNLCRSGIVPDRVATVHVWQCHSMLDFIERLRTEGLSFGLRPSSFAITVPWAVQLVSMIRKRHEGEPECPTDETAREALREVHHSRELRIRLYSELKQAMQDRKLQAVEGPKLYRSVPVDPATTDTSWQTRKIEKNQLPMVVPTILETAPSSPPHQDLLPRLPQIHGIREEGKIYQASNMHNTMLPLLLLSSPSPLILDNSDDAKFASEERSDESQHVIDPPFEPSGQQLVRHSTEQVAMPEQAASSAFPVAKNRHSNVAPDELSSQGHHEYGSMTTSFKQWREIQEKTPVPEQASNPASSAAKNSQHDLAPKDGVYGALAMMSTALKSLAENYSTEDPAALEAEREANQIREDVPGDAANEHDMARMQSQTLVGLRSILDGSQATGQNEDSGGGNLRLLNITTRPARPRSSRKVSRDDGTNKTKIPGQSPAAGPTEHTTLTLDTSASTEDVSIFPDVDRRDSAEQHAARSLYLQYH